MKADAHWVRDSLVEDAVKPAQAAGRVVDSQAAADHIVGILEGMDRKQAAAKPVAQKVSEADKVDIFAEEFKKRTGRDLGMTLEREMAPRKIVPLDKLEAVGRQRLAERLRWIKSKPDLYQRVKGLAVGLTSPSKPTRERAGEKMREFIAMTDRLAGFHWGNPKPKKLTFGG